MSLFFDGMALLGFILTSVSAVYVLATDQGSRLGRLFFAYTGVTAAYNLIQFLAQITPDAARSALYYRLGMLLFVLLMAALLHFFVVLARKEALLKQPGFYLAVYLPIFLVSWFIIGTPWFLEDVRPAAGGGFIQVYGPYFRVLWAHALICIAAVSYYFRSARVAAVRKQEINQLNVIRAGMFFAFGFGILLEIVLPFFGLRYLSFIPLATVIYSLFFTYAFIRYGLLVITPLSLAQDIVETMPDFLLFADPQGKVALVNDFYLKTCGYKRQEVIGSSFQDLASIRELWLKKWNGEKLPVVAASSSIMDRSGEEVGILYIFHDVSEERRLLEQQQATVTELTAAKMKMTELLEASGQQLRKTNQANVELEEFHKMAVGRELKMIELEKELGRLNKGTELKEHG